MVSPDAEIDGKGVVIISSEDDFSVDTEKTLKDVGLSDGSILSCDDFLQDYNVKIIIYQCSELEDGVEFELVGDLSKLQKQEDENGHKNGGLYPN